MNRVLAIIVAYEHPEALDACIVSLKRQTYEDLDIVVWDNTPGDIKIPSSCKDIWYSNIGINLYWTPALNAAIIAYRDKNHGYVLTLNHDMELPPSCIEDLVIAFDKLPYHAGAVGPTSYGIGGLQGATVKKYSNHERVNYLIGACAMYKVEVFDKIGLFDENMPLSGDDFDFALRMREAGYSLWVNESVHANHLNHVTGNSENWDTIGKQSWAAFEVKYANYFKDEAEAIGCLWGDARYNPEFDIGTGISDEEKIARGIKCPRSQ